MSSLLPQPADCIHFRVLLPYACSAFKKKLHHSTDAYYVFLMWAISENAASIDPRFSKIWERDLWW